MPPQTKYPPFAAVAQLPAHTQPALRTGLMAPAWRLLHVSRRVILDLTKPSVLQTHHELFFQQLTPESCGALHSPCGGAPQQRGPLTPQQPNRLHTYVHLPSALHTRVWMITWMAVVSGRDRPRKGARGAQGTYRGGSRGRLQGGPGLQGPEEGHRGDPALQGGPGSTGKNRPSCTGPLVRCAVHTPGRVPLV